MRKLVTVAVICLLTSLPVVHAGEPELQTDDQKTLYALGLALSRSLESFSLSESEIAVVLAGLTDGTLKREPKVALEEYQQKIQELGEQRRKAAAEMEKKSAKKFLDQAAAEKGAKRTASGLIYSEIKPGAGEQPKATDKVKVHYHGTLIDGTVFDSSVDRGQPATFPLNRVVPCWTEGVQMMNVGGKSKLICPSDIAYGDSGRPPKIKPGATLIFEVELLEILK